MAKLGLHSLGRTLCSALLVTALDAQPGGENFAQSVPAELEWIKLSGDRRGFVKAASGGSFIPWGFNYDRDYKSRLLEDYWESEWPTVVEDFHEMKDLGANVVRVHLQFSRFMEGPDRPNKKTLDRLAKLLRLAEETRLYLDLTGLACYRKADAPPWFTGLDEPDRWNAQAGFWEAVSSRCAGSPAVFCYDLMNEPIAPQGKRKPGDWLTGELAGFTYCQFISLDQAGRPRSEIARQWVARLTAAIRKRDQRHLVTVGFLPNSLQNTAGSSGFIPKEAGAPLDFICVHLYPQGGHAKADLELLQGFNTGKPVVIEEIFPLNCTIAELRQFFAASRDSAAGWFGFYWGQTPAQLAKSAVVADALTREWLTLFQEMNPGSRLPEAGSPARSPR